MLQELVLRRHGEELEDELVGVGQEVVVLVDFPGLPSSLQPFGYIQIRIPEDTVCHVIFCFHQKNKQFYTVVARRNIY